jgi:ABC-type dipeptide/oligopeptide/nickel transport systems, permease components
MRWFLRRLGFYVFAIWVALTITFLLPRVMPGDPIGGILQRLSPAQIQSNPGIIKTYQALLGGGNQSIWSAYWAYLHHVATLNFGISTSNYPTAVSEVVARTLPYSIVLVGVAFIFAFILGTAVGAIAAWRRGGSFDSIFMPFFMVFSAFPAYFHRPAPRLLLRAEARLVPDPARVRQRGDTRRELAVRLERLPPRHAARARDRPRLRRRLGVEHAHGHDQHDQ